MRIEPSFNGTLARSSSTALVRIDRANSTQAVQRVPGIERSENDMARARLIADIQRHLRGVARKGRNIDITV